MNKKSFLSVFSASILIFGLVLVVTTHFGTAQPGLITFINSDTSWTKANSPYNLTGPVVVSTGVTLTIDAGVIVDFNGYYLFVNGTLRAIGSSADNIRIFGGDIDFGDNNQVGVNSIFENAVLNSTITSTQPLSMNNNTLNNGVTVGNTSVLSKNNCFAYLYTGNSCTLTGNIISGDVSLGDSCSVFNNTIHGDITTGTYATIMNNTINGSKIVLAPFGGHSYTIALTVSSCSTISDNAIIGGVSAASSTISNNTISGGAPFTDWAGRPEDATSAVTTYGNSSVVSNIIFSSTGGYGLLIRSGYTFVSGNIVSNGVRIAGDALIEGNLINNSGNGIRVGEIFISAFNDIDYGHGDSIIRNNVITGNSVGIGSTQEGGTATIENNLISNNTCGICVSSQVMIHNNTIRNSSVAINLQTSLVEIIYNNILEYSENSIQLSLVSAPINATYNWWGTTDTQAINLTIYDFKYDLNLGKVSFVPILNEMNSQAPSTSYSITMPSPPPLPIPELPSWVVLTLFLFVILVPVILEMQNSRRKIEHPK